MSVFTDPGMRETVPDKCRQLVGKALGLSELGDLTGCHLRGRGDCQIFVDFADFLVLFVTRIGPCGLGEDDARQHEQPAQDLDRGQLLA